MKKNISRILAMTLVVMSLLASMLSAQATTYISSSRAKNIALKHAKRSSSAVRFTKVRRERDDGRMIYDIEFRLKSNRNREYEYEIDARTGRILDYDWDYDD